MAKTVKHVCCFFLEHVLVFVHCSDLGGECHASPEARKRSLSHRQGEEIAQLMQADKPQKRHTAGQTSRY